MNNRIKYKTIFKIAVLTLLALVTFSVFMYNKPHKNIARSKPSLFLSTDVIVSDFENNESEANTKYLEKVIEVKGTIANIEQAAEQTIVTLATTESMGGVMCYLPHATNQYLEKLNVADVVKIKGVCTGYLMDVVLVKCVLIKDSNI